MAETKEKKYVSDNAQLMAEWDWEKNVGILPTEITIGSRKTVWWVGKCGHLWEAIVKDRIRGYGCPICAGKRVIEGVNDLKSNFPEISSQWDYNKNHPLLPQSIASRSHKQAWWICDNGHSYKSSVDNRTRGRGCPYCSSKIVSVGENDLASQNPFLLSEYSSKNTIPATSVFVNSHQKVWWVCSVCRNEWSASVDSRNRGNGCPICAQRAQSSFPEQAIYFYVKRRHSDTISRFTNKDLERYEIDIFIPSLNVGIEYDGKHWHKGIFSDKRETEKYAKCKALGITLIRIREDSKITDNIADYTINSLENLNDTIRQLSRWSLTTEDICIERDRYEIMSNYMNVLNTNSFAYKHPKLAQEWCYEKNGNLTPDMFSEYSTQSKFWWICERGHYWQSTIAHRTAMGSNCPYCSNRRVLKGYNDFLTTNQNGELINEWSYSLNEANGIFPDSIVEGSKKKVWWICSMCGHEWSTTISSRKKGSSCPNCKKIKD